MDRPPIISENKFLSLHDTMHSPRKDLRTMSLSKYHSKQFSPVKRSVSKISGAKLFFADEINTDKYPKWEHWNTLWEKDA